MILKDKELAQELGCYAREQLSEKDPPSLKGPEMLIGGLPNYFQVDKPVFHLLHGDN